MGNLLEKNKLNLHCSSGIRVKDKFYFSEAFFNGLFELDLNDFSVKFICHFSGESNSRMLCHGRQTIKYKDTIYFFPICIKRIHYYDLTKKEENNILLSSMENDEEFVVSSIIQKNNKIWMFSANHANGVFILDMDEKKIIKSEKLSGLLLKYNKVTNFIEISEEGKAAAYCISDAILLEVDVELEQIKEYKLRIENANIGAVNYHDGKFYFIDAVLGDLYELQWNNRNLQKFAAQGIDKVSNEGALFFDCCFVGDSIYMLPLRNKHVMKIGTDGIMEKAFEYPKDFQVIRTVSSFYKPSVMLFFEVVDNEIWFYPYGSNQLLIYDTKTGMARGRKIDINADKVFPCEGIMRENARYMLEYYCCCLGKSEHNYVVSRELYGREIYKIGRAHV